VRCLAARQRPTCSTARLAASAPALPTAQRTSAQAGRPVGSDEAAALRVAGPKELLQLGTSRLGPEVRAVGATQLRHGSTCAAQGKDGRASLAQLAGKPAAAAQALRM
jgi:hypothetical protein